MIPRHHTLLHHLPPIRLFSPSNPDRLTAWSSPPTTSTTTTTPTPTKSPSLSPFVCHRPPSSPACAVVTGQADIGSPSEAKLTSVQERRVHRDELHRNADPQQWTRCAGIPRRFCVAGTTFLKPASPMFSPLRVAALPTEPSGGSAAVQAERVWFCHRQSPAAAQRGGRSAPGGARPLSRNDKIKAPCARGAYSLQETRAWPWTKRQAECCRPAQQGLSEVNTGLLEKSLRMCVSKTSGITEVLMMKMTEGGRGGADTTAAMQNSCEVKVTCKFKLTHTYTHTHTHTPRKSLVAPC
ncbi:hypothetical protein EYF80_035051 [Liparis tanakae]|uniref:Uncharacterized protein n=1 Tax=Liparis tanakae TaxID=230148 RepID=A0A4Z2GMB6_9TELE|nr:hypothetical protein EYF80_035051 [Liparis tanakae]